MVERIRMLLETRQLTPTQFADAIGVARPIVSHILSGRNKPSLEVVQRILAAMPELSMPWLLNGTGPMQAAGSSPESAVDSIQPPVERLPAKQPSAASPAPEAVATPRSSASTRSTPVPAPVSRVLSAPGHKIPPANAFRGQSGPKRFTPATPKPEGKPAPEPLAALSQPVAATPPLTLVPSAPPVSEKQVESAPEPVGPAASVNPTAAALFAGAEKPIRRIVIFYKDGSFADYQPE